MGRADELFAKLKAGGEQAVRQMVIDREREQYFLDFKRSHDKGAGATLAKDDLHSLAKAISGFGNSEGGVVVWGIDCRRDKATGADLPLDNAALVDPTGFASRLESIVSLCTVPSHAGVVHEPLLRADGTGYVATLVPKSERGPHQVVVDSKDRDRYFLRAGSQFSPVPHGVLAGMFGRAPQPRLTESYVPVRVMWKNGQVVADLAIQVSNVGMGIARDIFITLMLTKPLGPSATAFYDANAEVWSRPISSYGDQHCVVVKEGVRLPPGASMHVLPIHCVLVPPFPRDLVIEGVLGATGAAPHHFTLRATVQALTNLCSALNGNPAPHMDKSASPHLDQLFGIRCV